METKPSDKIKTGNLKIYYILFIGLILLSLFSSGDYIFFSTILSFLTIILFDRPAVKEFGNPRFWVFILIIALFIPISLGDKNSYFMGIAYSSENLNMAAVMIQRALIIYTGVILFTRNVSILSLINFFTKLGFKDFGLSLSIAINLIPLLKRNITNIYNSFILRGGFRRNVLKNIFKFVVVVLVNTIRTAEELAEILEVKGIV